MTHCHIRFSYNQQSSRSQMSRSTKNINNPETLKSQKNFFINKPSPIEQTNLLKASSPLTDHIQYELKQIQRKIERVTFLRKIRDLQFLIELLKKIHEIIKIYGYLDVSDPIFGLFELSDKFGDSNINFQYSSRSRQSEIQRNCCDAISKEVKFVEKLKLLFKKKFSYIQFGQCRTFYGLLASIKNMYNCLSMKKYPSHNNLASSSTIKQTSIKNCSSHRAITPQKSLTSTKHTYKKKNSNLLTLPIQKNTGRKRYSMNEKYMRKQTEQIDYKNVKISEPVTYKACLENTEESHLFITKKPINNSFLENQLDYLFKSKIMNAAQKTQPQNSVIVEALEKQLNQLF